MTEIALTLDSEAENARTCYKNSQGPDLQSPQHINCGRVQIQTSPFPYSDYPVDDLCIPYRDYPQGSTPLAEKKLRLNRSTITTNRRIDVAGYHWQCKYPSWLDSGPRKTGSNIQWLLPVVRHMYHTMLRQKVTTDGQVPIHMMMLMLLMPLTKPNFGRTWQRSTQHLPFHQWASGARLFLPLPDPRAARMSDFLRRAKLQQPRVC